MRAIAWLTVIVALALAAGVGAFSLATPDQATRVPRDKLGFVGLSRREVDARMHAAATFYAARHRRTATSRGATANARAWLLAIAGSRVTFGAKLPSSIQPGATEVPARRRIRSFIEWADDIPPTVWAVTVHATLRRRSVAGGTDEYTVAGRVEVSTAQAAGPQRRQTVPVTLRVMGIDGGVSTPPRRWLIRDVVVAGPDIGLRAYDDPTVVHRPALDVVAPDVDRVAATYLADAGEAALGELHDRYPGMGAPASIAVWLLPESSDAGRVLGTPAPSTMLAATRETPHGFSWVDAHGDVALDLSRATQLAPMATVTALRRELTLLSLRAVAPHAPALILEGVAAREARGTKIPGQEPAAVAFAPLLAAFQRGDVHLAELLAAPPGTDLAPGATPAAQRNAYLAGEALIGWVERERGHAGVVRLLRQLRDGVPLERALRDVLRMDVPTLERGVAAWTVDVVRSPPVPIAPTAGTGVATTTRSSKGLPA